MFEVHGNSVCGPARHNNEDYFAYREYPEHVLLAIADGLGGYPYGEVASRIAVESALEYLDSVVQDIAGEEDLSFQLDKAFNKANIAILRDCAENPNHLGMCSTLTIAFVARDRITVAHFGDCRAYLVRSGELLQLTEDHNLTGYLLRAGTITEEEAQRPVSQLSGGQVKRIALARVLAGEPDLLILDEPTNHLDMRSKDVLKDAIREFDGTVIVVSHDREFLDGLVTKVYEFGGGRVREHLGGAYDYLRSRGEPTPNPSLKGGETRAAGNLQAVQKATPAGTDKSEGSLSYEARKEQQRHRRKLEKAVEEAEKKVAKIEAELKELEGWMATPSGAANPALFESYAKLKEDLTTAESVWEEAMMRLEE